MRSLSKKIIITELFQALTDMKKFEIKRITFRERVLSSPCEEWVTHFSPADERAAMACVGTLGRP